MDNNLFNQDIVVDPNKDYLAELINEGGKFYNPDKEVAIKNVAKGKVEADLYVRRLETEQKQLRDELQARIKMEEFLDKMNSSNVTTSKSPESNVDNQSQEQGETTNLDIEKLLDQKLTERDRISQATRNLELVKQELKKSYGDNYVNKLKDTSQKTGVGEKFLNELAAQNPKAFLHFVGIEQKQDSGFFVPPQGETFKPNLGSSKNFKFYEDLRKTNPTQYWKPQTQNEMYKELSSQGDENFYK